MQCAVIPHPSRGSTTDTRNSWSAGALELAGYDPNNGNKLWWVNGLARIVIPTPVPLEDTVYMASWAPGGDSASRIALDPWSVALAKWDTNHDGKLSRRNQRPSP